MLSNDVGRNVRLGLVTVWVGGGSQRGMTSALYKYTTFCNLCHHVLCKFA